MISIWRHSCLVLIKMIRPACQDDHLHSEKNKSKALAPLCTLMTSESQHISSRNALLG